MFFIFLRILFLYKVNFFIVNKMQRILKTSEDGSSTVYSEQTGETYHSIHGAYTESMHVFINNGLSLVKSNKINVLEIGFGTGLNAWLSYIYAINKGLEISYDAYELYPLPFSLVNLLTYKDIYPEKQEKFELIHSVPWETTAKIDHNFYLSKKCSDITVCTFNGIYDMVYFDAFSPDSQPEMWTGKVFEKIFQDMNHEGILTTYCVKGIVKRALKEVGFKIEVLPGPPGKRHMLRAWKM